MHCYVNTVFEIKPDVFESIQFALVLSQSLLNSRLVKIVYMHHA